MKELASAVLLALAASLPLAAQQGKDGFLTLPSALVALDSGDGKALFAKAEAAPFWRLIQFYSIQPNLSTCGVASCTMVLNSLPIQRPLDPHHGVFGLFTPENFFTPAVSEIIKREKVYKSGMSLEELGKALSTFPVQAVTMPADKTTLDAFREEVRKSAAGDGTLILVNYLRKSLGQETGGHISPVGAYSAVDDRVLVLDVSTYKYPWVWVKTEDLYKAMGTGGGTHRSRGYVVVNAKR